ncbi:aminodeoxychorismate lyase [Peribacillus alkalitolerans]|uniref:aminodeoxychorismate lyase n=1 Tax=Peribacillus alkalitolerans TaxID=1550385 RepID=UPI001967974F|nr:aminodeoxychorismate lyase [Peribacillus alkalitolerans]
MRINLLTSFASGLLIATTINAVAYFSEKNDVEASTKTSDDNKTEQVQLSDKEMKNKLESSGYVVLTKAEYDKKVKETKASKENATASKEKQGSSKEESKPVTKVIVNVSLGMTSIDVGKILVDAKLVPDAFKFSKDVEKRKLEKELRPGKFEVNSSMSYDQIISTIFVKK